MKKLIPVFVLLCVILSACAAPGSPANPSGGSSASAPATQGASSTSPSSASNPALSTTYLLAGSRFPAYANGVLNTSYDLFVELDGRFWQPNLPAKPQRVAHSVSFELAPGRYEFNGVECKLYVDAARNGKGSQNSRTVGEGNGLAFSVLLPQGVDYKTAWALVECAGNQSTGFDIKFLGN